MKRKDDILILGLIVGCLFFDFFLQKTLNPYIFRIVVNCGIAIILALSLNLINGYAGQFSLGHAGFMGVGAYTSAVLTTLSHLYFFQSPVGVGFAIILGGLVSAFFGYLVGLPSLRLKGDYLAIVTLGFGEIIRIVILNIPWLGGPRGLPGIPIRSNFFWVYFWVVATLVVLIRFLRSNTGRAVLAIRDDEIAAESMGVDIAHYKVLAFVLSSFFAGIAGGLFAHFQGFIDPNSFNFNRSVDVIIMVVIGGMGSLSGSIVGALIVTIFPEFLRAFDQFRMVIFSGLLIALMLLRPKGIMGHGEIWDFIKKQKVFQK